MNDLYTGIVGVVTKNENLGLGVYNFEIEQIKRSLFIDRGDYFRDVFSEEKYKKEYYDCNVGEKFIYKESLLPFEEYLLKEEKELEKIKKRKR